MAVNSSLENEAEMKKLIANEEIEFVRLECPDINGCSRGLHLDSMYFLNNYLTTGFGEPQAIFCMTAPGELVSGTGILDEISYRNGGWFPDMSTFRVLPWLDKTASVLVNFHTVSGDIQSPLHPASPRNVCRKQLDNLSMLGFRLYSSFEYEFYLLDALTKKPVNNDVNCFSTQNNARFAPLANEIMRRMKSIGIKPEHFHAEYGPAQVELTMSPDFGLNCPDNAFRHKQLVKETAIKHGYMANFMSKPFPNFSGSSGHFNHSLWDANGKNIFYDADMKYGLSKIAQNWLAGLVYHSDTLLCLASPTPNCFERTNVGGFAPTNNAWGLDNRSLAYRVKNHGTKNVYFELRLAAAGANPYLLQAGCIVAGMDGIKRDMTLEGDPYEGEISTAVELPDHVKPLPRSLPASIDCLVNNDVFVEAFGGEFLKVYSTVKKHESELAEKHREVMMICSTGIWTTTENTCRLNYYGGYTLVT